MQETKQQAALRRLVRERMQDDDPRGPLTVGQAARRLRVSHAELRSLADDMGLCVNVAAAAFGGIVEFDPADHTLEDLGFYDEQDTTQEG